MELTYARWLEWGTRIALAVLVACFLAYAFGLVEPLVPREALARLWTMPVADYLSATGAPAGWGWLRFVGSGDYLNLVGIALLCLISVLCYARVLPLLVKADRVYALIAAAQILVLLVAASGWLTSH